MYNGIRRKVFVSYHHGGDQGYYDEFSRLFSNAYEVLHDNSLDRRIQSDNPEYVMRRIREDYLTGSSVTIVLCGRETPLRKYVDWEICASLNQQMGIVGLALPTITQQTDGTVRVPDRLFDNFQSGYAVWGDWASVAYNPVNLQQFIETAYNRSKSLITNTRPTMRRNSGS